MRKTGPHCYSVRGRVEVQPPVRPRPVERGEAPTTAVVGRFFVLLGAETLPVDAEFSHAGAERVGVNLEYGSGAGSVWLARRAATVDRQFALS